MSSIDTRVVEMQFDNKAFGSGVKDSLKDLDNLKKGLKLEGATSGIDDVSKAASRFSMQGDDGRSCWRRKELWCAADRTATALVNLTNKAVDAGIRITKALTIDPVKSGLDSYAEQINATQIIMANTKAAGTTLPQITAALANLQTYAQQTVYNFSDMTSNIGKFTAAGVKLQPATDAIKGMANVAALSGASTEQMSSAMYQMSQALAGGVIQLQDWNSLSRPTWRVRAFRKLEGNRQVDGRPWQAHGIVHQEAGQLPRLAEGRLADHRRLHQGHECLRWHHRQSTGKFRAFTVEELKAKGYSDAAAKSLQQLSQDALDSAINIRTIPQLFTALKEEVAGAWSQVFKTLFGDINQATSLFSNVHTVMENLLTGPVNALNEVLKKWAALGGRDAMLAGFKNAWEALGKILGPIKEAFRDIFPATSAENLVKMTNAFRDFTAKLIPSQKTMDGIKRTFAGLFAVLDIGKQLIGAVIHFIIDLVGHFSKGSGGILDFTAKIGDFLVHLDQAIKKGDIFGKFFDWLEPKIEKPVDALKHFVAIIGQMVKAVTGSQTMAAILDRIHKNSGQVADAGGKIASAWEKVKQVFSAIWQAVQPILSKIGDGVKNVVKDIAKALSGISFGDLLGAAGVGAFVALAMKIRSTIDKIFNRKKDKGPGFFDTIKETLEQLTGTLKSMQDALKVGMILAIAAAILALTFAVSILSKIDAVGLAKGVTAITFLITEVTGSMIVLSKMMDKKAKAIKFDLIAAGMILIATAIDILASAVKKLADLSWEQLAKGMSAVTLLLGEVILALNFMPNEGKMISSGAGIILIAAAIKVLVSAVTDMAALSWGDIAKGLSGVAALLLALGLYTKFSDMSSIGDGAGLVLMAASIKILVSAVQDMAGMSWEDIAKGLSGVAGGLIAMSAAIRLMPEDGQTLKNAASVVVIAAALKILASAMKDMSGLSWEDIGKAATSIAGGLGIIILALNGLKFEGNLGQAASLLIVTGAIKVLASAMQDLGGMTWSDIAAGLTALAGGMLIMVVALNSMEGTIPGSLALLAATPGISALASAMANLGGMSWSDIGAGLVALAGGLLILAGGLYLMEGTIPGSLGLLAATPGIYALAGAMKSMGGMTWADIGAGLVALGGALLVLAVGLTAMIITLPGAAALAVAAPALGALASGLASIGGMSWSDIAAGVVALGGSLVALAVGLTAMVASLPGAAALAVAAPALGDLASAMQKIGAMSWSDIAAAAGGITSFLGALAVGSAVSVSILALGGALSVAAPGLEQFVNAVLNSYGIGDNIKAVAAGLMEFSKIPADNLGNIAASADKIAKALPGLNTAVSQGLAPTVAAAIQQGADFANNFAKGINDNTGPSTQAGTNLLNKVKDAINGAIPGIAGEVSSNAQSVGKNIVDGVNVGVDNNKGSLNSQNEGNGYRRVECCEGSSRHPLSVQEVPGDWSVRGRGLRAWSDWHHQDGHRGEQLGE
jgi:hypothetical protein